MEQAKPVLANQNNNVHINRFLQKLFVDALFLFITISEDKTNFAGLTRFTMQHPGIISDIRKFFIHHVINYLSCR